MDRIRNLQRSFKNYQQKYSKMAFEHESSFLVIIIVVFILLSGVAFNFSGDRLQEINNLESRSSIDIQAFTLEPYKSPP